MAELVAPRLPRGRHGLSREQVEQDQRIRILMGLAEAMRAKGYVGTSVADVIKRAGVSRETFYQLYDSKLHCFLAAFDLVGDLLAGHLAGSLEGEGAPLDRFALALDAYLDTIASEPAYARLFLVEVYAAGPEAMARRAELQDRIAVALIDLFGARRDAERFACRVLVAAVASMVTVPLVSDDLAAVRALGPPLAEHAAGIVGTWKR